LYTSLNIIGVVKSRRMRWASNVACMIDMRNAYKILFGTPEVKRPREDLGVGGRIILKWMLGK